MSLTEYMIRGADNVALQINTNSLPVTVTFASLTPVDGSFPTFTTGPVVYIVNATVAGSNVVRAFEIDTIDTSGFRIISATSGPSGIATFNIKVETEDTPTSAPVGVVARQAPYYCSVNDVHDVLANIKNAAKTSGGVIDRQRIRRFILSAYGRLNGALAAAGYSVPVVLTQRSLFTNDPGTTGLQVINLPAGSDVNEWPVASTVRINSDISATEVADDFTAVRS